MGLQNGSLFSLLSLDRLCYILFFKLFVIINLISGDMKKGGIDYEI